MSISKTRLQNNPLLVIVGPTAVGKTQVSIELARRLDAEIVSADSRLFYRGMDIGTAKPTPAERQGIPHHLIDVADPDEVWSLALFQQAAHQAIGAIHARGKLPILVGGTGQYVKAVIEGWQPPEQPPIPSLRAVLERMAAEQGKDAMHAMLTFLDPIAAQKIDPRNVRRTIRALEVIFSTGRRFSDQRRKTSSPYQVQIIGLTRNRKILYERVDARIEQMLQQGFLDEVRRLLEKYPPDLPAFSAIGYRQMIEVVQGKRTLEEAVAEIKRLTRRYVRQQGAWFREEDPQIHWFDLDQISFEEIFTFVYSWWKEVSQNESSMAK
ncbi:tRNA (adenosine(37)-N6)-dimethylallyltransferase MiaA [Anaerolinea thermophila]|uniref:tRNA dimethylallyltransferase n=1 Tax=Anaerolinea thermophila (strain DSM 14523 / JCM 11388 / NBRC 100420 / UNI-1) TaxID=926569 RepID=E8MXN6_ANATU|nr:tRNA (adenosine(37)-N6)-dimethylallyltransferase MiaA [Anaerolinea thermophila]BAJ64117.1 tRNA delta(2)-isopentenylpyrophosphate transferase [Anaerolinea thermophila UNI-1]